MKSVVVKGESWRECMEGLLLETKGMFENMHYVQKGETCILSANVREAKEVQPCGPRRYLSVLRSPYSSSGRSG
jgi:hypothetical protein